MSLYFKINPLWCFKGGGGGGGTGAVSHSAYMETFHGQLLDHAGVDTPTSSLIDIINAALGNSPYAGELAYDPAVPIAAWETALTNWDVMLAAITETTDWADLHAQAVTSIDGVVDAEITADVIAFAAEQDDQILTVTLPRFQAGMRDINAVVSSAFVVGEALIEGFRDRDVARHSSKLRIASIDGRANLYMSGTDQMLRFLLSKYAWEESYARHIIEANRLKIVALKEETDVQLEVDESDAVWDLELFAYGGNLLAGIGGGVATSKPKKKNTAASVMGGAVTMGVAGGMMAGAQAGGVTGLQGAAIGAVLGAAMAYMSQ